MNYKYRSKVLLSFGSWEITVRELIFGILLFAIYIIGGLCIYEKIDRAIEDHNIKYTAAVWECLPAPGPYGRSFVFLPRSPGPR